MLGDRGAPCSPAGEPLQSCAQPATGEHFSLETGDKRGRECYCVPGVCHAKGGPMTFIIAILSVPFLMATGIYSPKVVHHGRCIAQPGSFDALFCPAPKTPAYRVNRKKS